MILNCKVYNYFKKKGDKTSMYKLIKRGQLYCYHPLRYMIYPLHNFINFLNLDLVYGLS